MALAAAVPADDEVVVAGDERSGVLRNGRLAATWDATGQLCSIVDLLAERELVPAGKHASAVELAVDHPVRYDAWDVEHWARRAPEVIETVASIEVVAAGPLIGIVRIRRTFGPSSVSLSYVLRAGSSRLDVEVELDWQHDERLLSIAFPLDVRADTAACDVQFGVVHRPTHRSTSWDAAKFEVCAHRFVDLSEPSFGVAVLNDGRYGHGLFDGAVRISLARAAKYPDPTADRGLHRVTLAVLPHGPGLAEVVAEAERLNRPIRLVTDGEAGGMPAPPVVVDGRGIEVDAVKQADDGSGDLIVRLHEACGDRTSVRLRGRRPFVAAARCDLFEDPSAALVPADGSVELTLRPFELVTLRLSTGLDVVPSATDRTEAITPRAATQHILK